MSRVVTELSVRIRVRWWVIPYIGALAFFSQLTGLTPDPEKAAGLIMRYGTKFEVSLLTNSEA